MTEEQLSALLRLKRFEQPPAQYFDRLLQDVHRRQRADLLRLPLWKIALERMQTFFGEHSMGHLSYAGALASVLVVGVTTIGLMTPGGTVQRNEIAERAPAPAQDRLIAIEGNTMPTLGAEAPSIQTPPPGLGPVGSQPRYIMDARPVVYPVVYEPSSF